MEEGTQSALMNKEMKCCPNELLHMPNSAMEFLCDAEKSQGTIFTEVNYFVTFQISCLCFTVVPNSDLCISEPLEALLWK